MPRIADVLTDLGLPPLPEPLPASVVDSHTHADSVTEMSHLSADDNLAAAQAVGVERIVQVGCDEESSVFAAEFARRSPHVVAAVALHPNEVARHPERVADGMATVRRLAAAGPHVRAVGETGLDYYRTTDADGQQRQRDAFAEHIEIARATRTTLVIHDRDAHADALDVLDANPAPERVVMHCFSGDAAFAKACVDRGYWLSFPGVITYKANGFLREALRVTPRDRVLVETDAPYLTPVPARGRPNASYLLAHTVRYVAEQRGWDLVDACRTITANTFAAFGGPWGDDG